MEIEMFLEKIIPYITGILESIGVFIIVLSTIKTFIAFIKGGFNFSDEKLKIELAKALALSLEFKLAAEILKTVIVRTIDEFIILSAVVILRVILTFVIHWEIKTGMKDEGEQVKEHN
ncbi:DUF1622 domain-containing protein [Sporanaerobacter acetigenes]|uniref:Uncharacterized membrane protein n=1 Tax=Sporanaerobacter acetigenes DSM 13106 TaxID=1123281 RepID=A0A1M5VVH1_9FIRM|nr:DUF1622 domain-containing protein [Sporanaerobacter acetigenes]SHH79190.1 Uncharacterized membrane protein [Sporanaerobacter acetigenes DSM 13106]